MAEIVYVLTNEAMPGIVKIGKTTDIEQRKGALDNTSIPLPFQCYYAARVDKSAWVEKKVHDIFGDKRIRKNREFFRVDPSQVKCAIELVAIEDVTPRINDELSSDDRKALDDFNERRQPFRFSLARVPVNAKIQFERDKTIECRVVSDKNIEFEGEITTLSRAASILLERRGWKSSPNVQGPLYWLYEDETLNERRLRFEDKVLTSGSFECPGKESSLNPQ